MIALLHRVPQLIDQKCESDLLKVGLSIAINGLLLMYNSQPQNTELAEETVNRR
jgi:hypothetical protein